MKNRRTVLVTGGCGFIGANFIHLLRNKYPDWRVINLDKLTYAGNLKNLQSISENVSAARARIMDADFAAETAEMTKAQVLQQAGVAMLAQANMLPQAVLSLLQ